MIRRWTHPLVADSNFTGRTSFTFHRNGIYREAAVKLARSAVIEQDTVIGEGTEVAAAAVVSRSVVGRGCRIGSGAVVRSSVLWDGVEVHDGASESVRARSRDGPLARRHSGVRAYGPSLRIGGWTNTGRSLAARHNPVPRDSTSSLLLRCVARDFRPGWSTPCCAMEWSSRRVAKCPSVPSCRSTPRSRRIWHHSAG